MQIRLYVALTLKQSDERMWFIKGNYRARRNQVEESNVIGGDAGDGAGG
jgi:hypothetical protein